MSTQNMFSWNNQKNINTFWLKKKKGCLLCSYAICDVWREIGQVCINHIYAKFPTDRSEHIQYNLNGSNTDGSFTVDDSNSFQSLQNSSNSSRKQIFRNFFLFYHGIVCCVYSLELPH